MAEIGTERLIMRSWRQSDLAPWAAMNAATDPAENFDDPNVEDAGPRRHVVYRKRRYCEI